MTTPLTDQQVEEARALDAAATKGPWTYSRSGFVGAGNGHHVAQTWDKTETDFPNAESNGRLIAAARELLPAALARIDADRERWERAQALLRDYRRDLMDACPLWASNEVLCNACPACFGRVGIDALLSEQPK